MDIIETNPVTQQCLCQEALVLTQIPLESLGPGMWVRALVRPSMLITETKVPSEILLCGRESINPMELHHPAEKVPDRRVVKPHPIPLWDKIFLLSPRLGDAY